MIEVILRVIVRTGERGFEIECASKGICFVESKCVDISAKESNNEGLCE